MGRRRKLDSDGMMCHSVEPVKGAFAAKGYRDTTVADIAQELGMGHGTFYRLS